MLVGGEALVDSVVSVPVLPPSNVTDVKFVVVYHIAFVSAVIQS